MDVFEIIKKQQEGQEGTTVFTVGQQLSDICRADGNCASIVEKDLQVEGMSISDCEKKIKAYADEVHKKTKKNVGIDPATAEKIIREFYGLPGRQEEADGETEPATADLDLADFF